MNNPFLTKKDSLVEAVQSAMQDGELRRQAEALVNEEFGVYSRKAVVREQLAAYDARLEEAYKCMKEEDKKDEKPKSGYSKEKDKHKAAYSKMREKMVGKGKDYETTSKIVGEAKKLADKDYDKDGKIESPKDEVWGSRFRAAKMAGKMEEEQIDEISRATLKSYVKKADRQAANLERKVDRRTDRPGEEDKMYKRIEGARLARRKMGVRVAATEETQVDEAAYSAKAARAGKDIGKPGKMFSKIAKKAGEKYGSEERGKKVAGAILANIRAKHMKEDSSF